MSHAKKAVIAIVVIIAIGIFNELSRPRAIAKARGQLAQACNGEKGCRELLDEHFDRCVGESVRFDRRLNEFALVRCLNDQAGDQLFSVHLR